MVHSACGLHDAVHAGEELAVVSVNLCQTVVLYLMLPRVLPDVYKVPRRLVVH